jgi:hypothetical protein
MTSALVDLQTPLEFATLEIPIPAPPDLHAYAKDDHN